MDIHRFYQPFFRFFRRKRIQILFDLFEINRSTKVLDLGGNCFFWNLMMSEGYEPPTVIVMNLEAHEDVLPEFMTWVVADGMKLPFKDSAFDLVFCNSVIEHVGEWKNQEALAAEIRRVAPHYFVQTPNRYFPIEPHMIALFIHWLPRAVQRRFFRYFTIRGLITQPALEEVDKFLDGIKLLSQKEMKILFPDSQLKNEWFLGMPKSLVCIR